MPPQNDWTANHELALMGYSMRVKGWRYIAWLRAIRGGGSGGTGNKKSGGSGGLVEWHSHDATAFLNWTWPPYATELYRHRQDHELPAEPPGCSETTTTTTTTTTEVGKQGDEGRAAYDALRANGGGFDLDENVNVAPLHPERSKELFELEKRRLHGGVEVR